VYHHGIEAPAREDTAAARDAALLLPEPFAVEIQPDRERVFVIPRGELDVATAGQVSEEIDDLVTAGFKAIVLDLRRLSFMGSTGIRLVLHHTRRKDATVQLIDGAEPIRRVFDVVGLRDVLPFVAPSS
jgi:anti-sigma B factor antagonist